MDWLTGSLAIVLGIFLRIAIPVAVTVILIFLLRWLDERWKEVADIEDGVKTPAKNVGCWEINNCPAERRAQCKAYANQDIPCWQVFRGEEGLLQKRCLGCDIFKHAPQPI
jgi:hypothetical protein